jgi:hypothetical protein
MELSNTTVITYLLHVPWSTVTEELVSKVVEIGKNEK